MYDIKVYEQLTHYSWKHLSDVFETSYFYLTRHLIEQSYQVDAVMTINDGLSSWFIVMDIKLMIFVPHHHDHDHDHHQHDPPTPVHRSIHADPAADTIPPTSLLVNTTIIVTILMMMIGIIITICITVITILIMTHLRFFQPPA